ncbi:MAG: efflux RND transporter periplasmic adaptor subunit [Acidithiobacillus sp.]|uniref:efflux RND transporter periplasmic adaptor subunit n=1 Tax=Acidithiobacillus sp. TaxID=1872118 RepID=UPI003D035580
MRLRKHWFLGLALGFSTLALSACGKNPPQAPATQVSVSAPVVKVTAQALQAYAEVPASVVADQQVQLSSRLMGYIRNLTVREGQAVQAGQVLFEVDPTDVVGQVQQAQAGLAEAESALADARSNYERFKALYAQQAIPEKQWDAVKSQYAMAQARAAAARAGITSAQAQLRYARVTAPFAGIIAQKFLQNGDLATPGHPILSIENPAHLQVQCSVSDDLFTRLHVGQSLAVQGDGQVVQARVLDLVATSDPMTHTHLVKLSLPDNSGLQSGSFVTVAIPTERRTGIVVPASALQDRAGIPGVFVVDAQGLAHYRMVRPGKPVAGGVEILSGLSSGEAVVAGNLAEIDNGSRIKAAGATHG